MLLFIIGDLSLGIFSSNCTLGYITEINHFCLEFVVVVLSLCSYS